MTAREFRNIALLFVKAQPAVFAPVKGGWGRGGATILDT